MRGRILLVDDDEAVLETTSALLDDAGYEVTTTTDPFAVPALLREHRPHLLLLDVHMPQISGGHLSRMYRGVYDRTVFLLFSGRPVDELASLATQYGADGYVQKGCHPTALVHDVTRWLRQRGIGGFGKSSVPPRRD